MRKKISPRITVAIVGTDPVIGRVLESLLQTAGYGTRFVTYPVTSESCNMVADAHVVLLLPGLSNISREGCPISEVSTAAATNIPILELIPEPDEVPLLRSRPVRWPCRLEQLRREIEAALSR